MEVSGYKERNRISSKAYTRNGFINFEQLISAILGGLSKSLGVEMYLLRNYFSLHSYSKQAFSKARKNLKPEAFIELNRARISNNQFR